MWTDFLCFYQPCTPLIRLAIIYLQVGVFSRTLAVFCALSPLYAELLLYALSLFLSSTLDLLSVLILDQNINEIVLTEKRKKKRILASKQIEWRTSWFK